MPPSPALASSDVAQERPAPPRSWMPVTMPAAKSSSVHSMSSFSMNGSPTWTLGRLAGPVSSNVSLGEDGDAADAVAAGAGAVQDDLVADAGRLGEVQVLVAQDADAQGVDERVAEVAGVEDRLAADVREAEAVAVAADAGHDPRQHAVGVRLAERAEPQRVHHRDRPGAHGQDVADDAADAGRGALVRLDVRRVVVALDLERDGVPLADVDHAGVLADAGQHLADAVAERRLLRDLGELPEVHLGRLVGAVLAPHDRVHRELAGGGAAAEDLLDPGVLVGLQPQLGPRLLALGVLLGQADGVQHEERLSAIAAGRARRAAPGRARDEDPVTLTRSR